MNLFYSPNINPSIPLLLSEEESAHCIKVLRMDVGHTIHLTDGKGFFYRGEIVSIQAKKCLVKIMSSIHDLAKRNFHLTIAIAPTKNIERFEWFLEKATEIGCDKIIPLACKHSERTVIKQERLNKVILSAMKQCLKSQLPELDQLTDFKKFIESNKIFQGQKLIGHIEELNETGFPPQNPKSGLLLKSLSQDPQSKILIAIGPEGGFSEQEVAFAVQNGFKPVSLGNSRLRVETAGVVACTIINSYF